MWDSVVSGLATTVCCRTRSYPGICLASSVITEPGRTFMVAKLDQFTIVDLHHDIAEDVILRRQRGEKDIFRRVWIPRLKEGGVKVQVFPIFLDSDYLPEMALRRELAMIHYLLDEIEVNAHEMMLIRTYDDIAR